MRRFLLHSIAVFFLAGCQSGPKKEEVPWPAVATPEHEANVEAVKTGLLRGQAYYDIADFDGAVREYQKVLEIDPYNQGAKYGIDRAERAKGMVGSRGANPYGY